MRAALLTTATFTLAMLAPSAGAAQQSPPEIGDSLRLGMLHADAAAADPWQRQLQLLDAQTALRLRNIAAERLPALSGEGRAQYQSDVTTLPLDLPDGQRVPRPANDTYDAFLNARQPLLDPTIGPRRAVERARLAESQAGVRTALYTLRQDVNISFFAAAAAQARLEQLRATIADLEVMRVEAAARVREGAALPSDTAAIAATIVERRQDEAQLSADRRTALARLTSLTGRAVDEADVLVLPDLGGAAAQARAALGQLRARPEYAQFTRARDRLAREAEAIAAREQPRVSAFGRLGYGRPWLNPLSDRFDEYWLAGVQVEWTPWSWGTAERERETLALQQQIVAADEAAFTAALERAVQEDLATIDRLEATLADDERVIDLREQIARESRVRFQEGVLTAAEYVDRSTDLLQAQLARVGHRIEMEQARARLLTTLGAEVR